MTDTLCFLKMIDTFVRILTLLILILGLTSIKSTMENHFHSEENKESTFARKGNQ